MVLQQNEQADEAPGPPPLTVTAPVPYAPSGSLRNPFPPIADYAFLSDCENTCLISSAGSVEWLCVPRPDSPSVFGAILDRGAGHFRLGPYGVSVPAARRYLPGSLILETTWQTHTGWVIVRDALVMGPWHDIESRSRTHRRTPMDWDAEHILLRTVRCVSGTVELVMNCEPSFDYHRIGASWEYSAQAYGEAIARANKNPDSHPTMRLTTNLRIGLEGREARARTRMKEGDNVFVALSWSKHPVPQTYDEAADKMWQTSECWRQWINIGDFPDHPWRSYLQRSALTLKGLTYSPTGALLAAPTTSLPETPQGERNWDYRYAWVRDSTFALWGLYTLGLDREADDFFAFIADVSGANNGERHPLQVMYAVGGERTLVEEELQPPVRLRQRPAGADRQRRLQPDAARHLGHHAGFGVPAHQVARADPREPVAGAQATGGRGHQALARARPRHLGGARRAAALHLQQDHVLGGAGPRLQARRAARARSPTRSSGARSPRRSRPTSLPTASTPAGCSPSATATMRWTRRCCWRC